MRIHRISMLRIGVYVTLALLSTLFWAPCHVVAQSNSSLSDREQVGVSETEQIITPVNQIVTPFGKSIDLPAMRPQAIALSPNGKVLVTAGNTSELVVIDAAKGEVAQRVKLPTNDASSIAPVSSQLLQPDEDDQLSFNGLIFSPAGEIIYMSNVNGSIHTFDVSQTGTVTPRKSWTLPVAGTPGRSAEIPAGLAVSDDGQKLYVCANLSNNLLELDTRSGDVLRRFAVGVAPYDVSLKGEKAYVSNWGGRRPGPNDLSGPAGRGTRVRVDPVRHIASEGSVSVINLKDGSTSKEVITGLHASGLTKSAKHDYVVCCNAASDTLSVIDTKTDVVVATIWAKPNAADLLGAAPNAAVFNADGDRLYVANGSQNAIAVVDFDADEPEDSRLIGMIPVGWYPGAIALDPGNGFIIAANIKGLPRRPRVSKETGSKGFNSHQHFGSITLSPIPSSDELPKLSERVARNLRAPRIADALLPPRSDQPARAIPQRIGEASLIKHVVYIIKENRTYDQVFGAFGRGNGDASLCIFGRNITPNHHKIADEFVLLDNTYCCGILSADGHQWSTTAFSTDYMEKSFAGFPRSYPDGMGENEKDALAYSPAGFIWDAALKHGKTLRNYGEFMEPVVRWRDPKRLGAPDFMACFQAWKQSSNEVVFESKPSVESMKPFSPENFVGWEMSVPDQFRADFILKELAAYERKGEFPNLVIICLPQDHTSGTSPACPTPAACMADNDLAFGRLVEGFSRSKFWPQMAIFAIEDDPQAGWDHVSGYRTIAFCASPYVKRGTTVSTQYNTTSILRTIGQILGMPPMNQFDASASPMFECFQDEPNFKPFAAAPALIVLDEMNSKPAAISDPTLRQDAVVSASINFRQVDKAPEDVLNRILWRSMRGSQVPYPQWAIAAHMDDDDD
jgi:DNA-binding beta-propeller fold protein YncE